MPSAVNFMHWRNDQVLSPAYNPMYDLTFTFFLGVKCFRGGIRRNNSDFMLAGRQVVARDRVKHNTRHTDT